MTTPRKSSKTKTVAKKRITFTLDAPTATSVFVSGSFCDWCADAHALKRNRAGTWSKAINLLPGRHEYRFIVDGHWQNDPACPNLSGNPYGSHNSVIEVAP